MSNVADLHIPPRRQEQLSMKVGGEAVGKHLFGTVQISGSLGVDRDLDLGDEVRVQIVSPHGEVLASTGAIIGAPAFKEQRDREGTVIAIERAHKAAVFS